MAAQIHYPLQVRIENTIPGPQYAYEERAVSYFRVDLTGVSEKTLTLTTGKSRNESGDLQPCINVRGDAQYTPPWYNWPSCERTYGFSILVHGDAEAILANTGRTISSGVLRLLIPDPAARLNPRGFLHPRRITLAATEDDNTSVRRIVQTRMDDMNRKPYLFIHSVVSRLPDINGDNVLEEAVFPNPFILGGIRSQFVSEGFMRTSEVDHWDLPVVIDVPGIDELEDMVFDCYDARNCFFSLTKRIPGPESLADLSSRCFSFVIMVKNATILMSDDGQPLMNYWLRDGRLFVNIQTKALFRDPLAGPSTSGRV